MITKLDPSNSLNTYFREGQLSSFETQKHLINPIGGARGCKCKTSPTPNTPRTLRTPRHHHTRTHNRQTG